MPGKGTFAKATGERNHHIHYFNDIFSSVSYVTHFFHIIFKNKKRTVLPSVSLRII